MKVLLALYPAAWRRRYGSEFRALLEDQPLSAATYLDVLIGALERTSNPRSQATLKGRSDEEGRRRS